MILPQRDAGHPALAQVVALDRRLRGDEALGELGLRHLEREQRDGLAVAERGVLGEVGHQRRLPHRRPRGQDDQVARLEAAGDRVEVLEARRRAGDLLALARELLELVELDVEDVVDRAEVLAAVLVRDLEDRALGDVDELARRRVVRVDAGLDLVRGAQQPAQHRVLAHDPRVLADVADRRDARRQQVDRGAAARGLELAGLLEVLDERERVDRLAAVVEVEHRREDDPVRLAVEVLGVQALVDDERGQRGVGEQHRAEDGLLGLEVLRRRDRALRHAGRRGVAVGGALGDAHGAAESRLRIGPNVCSAPQTRGRTRTAARGRPLGSLLALRCATSARPPSS